jgi:hypothetical protein
LKVLYRKVRDENSAKDPNQPSSGMGVCSPGMIIWTIPCEWNEGNRAPKSIGFDLERQRAENPEAEIFGRCVILRKGEAGSLYVGS